MAGVGAVVNGRALIRFPNAARAGWTRSVSAVGGAMLPDDGNTGEKGLTGYGSVAVLCLLSTTKQSAIIGSSGRIVLVSGRPS